jgi:quercetin dioxygenase-like cupin family protein
MSKTFDAGRSMRRGLMMAGAVTAAFAGVGGAAIAGDCPAGKTGDSLITSGPTEPVGVTDLVVGMIDVSDQIPEIPGHLLRSRLLVVQPGGVVPFHSHETRPALIYILEGQITEYSSDCAEPILHVSGDVSPETVGVDHWWKNNGTTPATLLSTDVVPSPDADPMM